MNRIISASRLIILLGVVAAFLLALALLAYGGVETIRLILSIFTVQNAAKEIALAALKSVDLLLLGTVLYIVCLGLYKLFIDENVPVAAWLEIHSIDDLKKPLISTLVILLSVLFVEQVIASKQGIDLLYLGFPIALVIATLSFYQKNVHE